MHISFQQVKGDVFRIVRLINRYTMLAADSVVEFV